MVVGERVEWRGSESETECKMSSFGVKFRMHFRAKSS